MKSNKNLFTKSFVFGLFGTLILFASSSIKAQANLQKAIASYINKVREDAVEYKEARKTVYGDVNGATARKTQWCNTRSKARTGAIRGDKASPFS